MSESTAGDIVVKSIRVHCSIEVAFRVWTERITLWWPKDHSISGNQSSEVFMERKIGGRFYERTPDGIEHQWGEVTAWEPPHHLAYNWYLGSDPQRPTKVDIRFIAEGQSLTRLEIEHRGPELIGDLWWERYSGYEAAWEDVLPCFGAACHSQEI